MTTGTQIELTALRRAILSMAACTEQRVVIAFDSIADLDAQLAIQVRHGDSEIDEMESDIDEECLRLLALHNPFAGDLRFVLATLRIDQSLERIADLAKNIAKRVLDLRDQPRITAPTTLDEMAASTKSMLANAIKALADGDIELATNVRQADDAVDEGHKTMFLWAVQTLPEQGQHARAILDLLSIARSIERIADLTTNIAEDVIFVVGGRSVRHTPS